MLRLRARGEQGLQEAVWLGQQSFSPRYEVRLADIRLSPQELNRLVGQTIDDGAVPFSQLHAYAVQGKLHPWTSTGVVQVSNEFLTTPSQANGALSLAAEAALRLRPRLGRSPDPRTFTRVFQNYVNSRFHYQNSGPHSHEMGTLYREGGACCQAVAALAVAVAGFLGMGCSYVKGEGWSGTRWDDHAWNGFADGSMADFTFGMNGSTPHTMTRLSAQGFRQNHRWTPCAALRYAPFCPPLRLQKGSRTLRAGQVLVTMDHPPLSEKGLDLGILGLVGGCAEYLPAQDALRLALPGGGRQWLLPRASRFLHGRCVAADALPWRPGPEGELLVQ